MARDKRIYREMSLFLGALAIALLAVWPWLRAAQTRGRIENRRSELNYAVNTLTAFESEDGPAYFDARRMGEVTIDSGIAECEAAGKDIEMLVASRFFARIDLSGATCIRRRSLAVSGEGVPEFIEWTIHAPAHPGGETVYDASGRLVFYDASNGLRSPGSIAASAEWRLGE